MNLNQFVPNVNQYGFRRRILPEFNSHLDFFELLNVIRCGSNTTYELGLNLNQGQLNIFRFLPNKLSISHFLARESKGIVVKSRSGGLKGALGSCFGHFRCAFSVCSPHRDKNKH